MSNLNSIFATEISNIQCEINSSLTNLVSRISNILELKKDNDLKDFVKITLHPPVILTLQLVQTTLQSISDIQRLFAEMPDVDSDPRYLLTRFVSFINWDEFFAESNKFKQKQEFIKSRMDEESNRGRF